MPVLLRARFLAPLGWGFFFLAVAVAQQPELVVQTGHSASVLCVAFSPNGKTLASGGGDKIVKLWDARNGREVRTLTGHGGYVTSVAFSPDGRTLASGSSDAKIKLWDVASGHELRTLTGYGGDGTSVAFSPDGRTLAGGSDTKIKLWDVASGHELRALGTQAESEGPVVFSPDGRTLASGSADIVFKLWDSGSADKSIKLWDVASGRLLRAIGGHGEAAGPVVFSPDGRTLASVSSGKTVKLWDLASGRELRTLVGHTGKVKSVAFSPDGKVLASGSSDAKIKLWDVGSGRELKTLAGHAESVTSVAFNSDGSALASGSEDQSIKLWDVASGRELRILAGHTGVVRSLTFGSTGRILAARNGDQTIKLWDLASRRELRTMKSETGSATSWFLRPDRHVIVRYDVTDWELNAQGGTVTYTPARVGTVALSPNERTLALGSSIAATVKLWDVASGAEVRTFAGHKDTVCSVAFSSDGQKLASGSWDGEVKVWDVASGSALRSLAGHTKRVESIAFSPDGHTLAAGSEDRTIKVWDVDSGRELRTLVGHGEADSIAFSSDGRALASANLDNTFNSWDASSGRELGTQLKQAGGVESVALSPALDTLASGSNDQTIKLWDARSGRELRTLPGVHSPVLAVGFSPNGQVVASGYLNGEIQLWDAAAGKQLAALFALDEKDWVVSDPEGRFDTANLDEIKGLSWVFPDDPLRALPPEIFMRDYYQPRLLRRVLAKERLPAVRSLADLNRTQPSVEVVKVEPETGQEFVSVAVNVTSNRSETQKRANGEYLESGAFDLRLFRDGQLVGEWPELLQPQAAESSSAKAGSSTALESWQASHEITLVDGSYAHVFRHIRLPHRSGVDKVQFTAYAFNSDRVKSLTAPPFEYLLPKVSASSSVMTRRAYLISMGVNANQSRWNLDFAVASAEDTARLLREKLAKDYEVVDTSLFSALAPNSPKVVLQQAIKSNLKAILDLLAGRPVDNVLRTAVDPSHKIQPATPDDAVVLFISSHGYADPQGTFYVVPYDTGTSLGVTEDSLNRCHAHPEDRSPACQKAGAFLEHTISSREFTAWWTGVDAGEMVMILDSCHSAAVPGREFRPGPLGDAGFGQLSYDKGMRILSATQPDKTARATLVEELGHSLLVEALLEEAKAHPQETLAAWLHDTEQQVPELTHRLYPELNEDDLQLPELFDFGVAERRENQASTAGVSQ